MVRVVRTTHRVGTREELSRETHYYLSSLAADAERHAGLVRHHWSVENTCHYTLDVTFHEDDCQVRDRYAAHKSVHLARTQRQGAARPPGEKIHACQAKTCRSRSRLPILPTHYDSLNFSCVSPEENPSG